MPFPVADWIISLFFLSTLFVVSRLKKQIIAVDKDSFRNIVMGLAVMALVSVIHVHNKLGVLSNVPFVSDPTFYQLLSWIGIITGMALLIFGVSTWLPIARSSRDLSRTKIRRLDFIKKVEQLVSVESRLDRILASTLEYTLDHFGLLRGAVYKQSTVTNRLILAVHENMSPRQVAGLMKARFEHNQWRSYSNGSGLAGSELVSGLTGGVANPTHVLPIVLDRQPVGFFLVWSSDGAPCDKEDLLNLKTGIDIIARKIGADRDRLSNEFLDNGHRMMTEMLGLIDEQQGIKENLSAMIDRLESQMPFDHFSLSLFGPFGGDMRRLSRGRNLAFLDETKLRCPDKASLAVQVKAGRETVIVDDIGLDSRAANDTLIQTLKMGSCLVMPVEGNSGFLGVLTIASRRLCSFRPRHRELLDKLRPVFAALISNEKKRLEVSKQESRFERLGTYMDALSQVTDREQAYRATVSVLKDVLSACTTRVSEIEDQGAFLKSEALSAQRPVEGLVPTGGRMILSLMPLHQAVVRSGRRMLIRQEDPQNSLGEAEASQALSADMKSGLLVPVKVDGEVIALISLMEMRSWDRFKLTRSDELFVEAVAAALGVALKRLARPETTDTEIFPGGTIPSAILEDDVIRTRLRSSLTGILGSIEILKSDQPRDESSRERYLSIIDNSAHKMEECLRDEF